MNILARLSETTDAIRDSEGFRSALKAFTALGEDLENLSPRLRSWLRDSRFVSVSDALFRSFEDRDVRFTSVPTTSTARRVEISHPKAMSLRMRNLTATAGGRALMRLAPHLALMSMEGVEFSAERFKSVGATYRKETAFFAALLSSEEGRKAVVIAAALAQQEWTDRFWRRKAVDVTSVDHLLIGNGPVGTAFAHALIDRSACSPFIISENEPGGSFAWGKFPVNHRSRPISPVIQGAPATQWSLDDLGPVLVSPGDISTTHGCCYSDIVAAVTALNAMAAGSTVSAAATGYDSTFDKKGDAMGVFTIESLATGERRRIRAKEQATIATGPGRVKELPGLVKGITVQELLSKPDPSSLGERVAVVGDGDSAMMSIAHLLGLHGSSTIPRQAQKLARIIWIRKSGLIHKETFSFSERLRYAEIAPFLPRVLEPAYPSMIQVVRGRLVDSDYVGPAAYLRCRNDESFDVSVDADAVINATGFGGDPLGVFDLRDAQVIINNGIPVARKVSKKERIYVIGAAAKLPLSETERDRFPILGNPKLTENTAALFRNVPAAVAFGRQSGRDGGPKQSLPALFFEPRSRRSAAKRCVTFGRRLLVSGSLVSSHTAVLNRLRLMIDAYGEKVKCGSPISIEIERASAAAIRVTSTTPVPQAVIQEVLDPIFLDNDIRRGLHHLCKTIDVLEEASKTLLRKPALSSGLTLTIPVRNGQLAAVGTTLAA